MIKVEEEGKMNLTPLVFQGHPGICRVHIIHQAANKMCDGTALGAVCVSPGFIRAAEAGAKHYLIHFV